MDQPSGWLVLLQQLPARPSNLRVATWRRLQDLGAVQLKNAAYVLPATADTREDFAWLRSEIKTAGGEATILETPSLAPDDLRAVKKAFAEARAEEYRLLTRQIDALRRREARRATPDREAIQRVLRSVEEQMRKIERRDFFASSSRSTAARALANLEQLLMPKVAGGTQSRLRASDYRRRVWLTRSRPGVDRLACAWLIRRFVDADARFRFSSTESVPAKQHLVRFDMFEGEFTHENGCCTFEVFVRRFGIDDPAVVAIAEVVHDVDLKDGRYGRAEAVAVELLVEGLRRSYADDADLLHHGMELFEWLHASLSPARAR